jgi:hypothetical protein
MKHYIGLLCCVVGIVLVGGSSILGGSGGVKGDASQVFLGMFLIIIAQVTAPIPVRYRRAALSHSPSALPPMPAP